MHPGSRRQLAFPSFAGDDGSADAGLAAALESGDHGQVLSSLTRARLLVPVVAMLGEISYAEGLAVDKSADMAVVLLTGQDGRRALLAFSSLDTLRAWQADARPMPATAVLAATAAVQEGADAIVIDVAGPRPALVESGDVRRLAAGHQVVRLADGTHAWATPASSCYPVTATDRVLRMPVE